MNRSGKGGFIFERSAIQALEFCEADACPNLRKLPTIFATLPVTTASSERSSSTMRRLKTHFRSTVGEQRLTILHCFSPGSIS